MKITVSKDTPPSICNATYRVIPTSQGPKTRHTDSNKFRGWMRLKHWQFLIDVLFLEVFVCRLSALSGPRCCCSVLSVCLLDGTLLSSFVYTVQNLICFSLRWLASFADAVQWSSGWCSTVPFNTYMLILIYPLVLFFDKPLAVFYRILNTFQLKHIQNCTNIIWWYRYISSL